MYKKADLEVETARKDDIPLSDAVKEVTQSSNRIPMLIDVTLQSTKSPVFLRVDFDQAKKNY